MVLSRKALEFEGKDVECIYEPRRGEVWVLYYNSFQAFMITGSRGKEEFYRNIFEDFDELLEECKYDNRVRRVVSCASIFMLPYEHEDAVLH